MSDERDLFKEPDMEVLGVLTGQVPVYPSCRAHREVAHSAEGDHWCNQCGWYHGGTEGPARKVGRPNGGFA